MAIAGAVASMLSVTLADALLPTLSVAVPVTTWLAPSAETVTGAGHVAIPDPPGSAQVNVTLTGVLFQPLAFGALSTVALIVGGVVSGWAAPASTIVSVSEVRGLLRSSTESLLTPARSCTCRSIAETDIPSRSSSSR